MRLKAIVAGILLLLAVLFVVDHWAPEWRDETRIMLRQLFRALH